jgi:hypothetical protein
MYHGIFSSVLDESERSPENRMQDMIGVFLALLSRRSYMLSRRLWPTVELAVQTCLLSMY